MAVRNFWIEADIDGKKTPLCGGPRGKDGGFTLRVYMRDKGNIKHALRVEGFARKSGKLELAVVWPSNEIKTEMIETER